jgi:two-component sensor histidine kinase
MVEESLVSPERPVRFELVGDTINLPAAVATPLALVLTELLQNAVGHAFAQAPTEEGATVGHVEIELRLGEDQLAVAVRDDGAGLPPGFDLDRSPGLGLSIVRTLVNSELGGSLRMRDRRDDGAEGTLVEVRIPLREVRVPA